MTVSFWESGGVPSYLVAMDDPETVRPVSWTRAGAILAFLAVALGAFGAHKLKTLVGEEQLVWWETGVQYQMAHALALLILGQRALPCSGHDPTATRVGSLFTLGVVLFSGSLYAMSLGGPRILGAVTPLGGLAFLGGWACWALGARSQASDSAGRASDRQ
jgi:uncharacterized membrane protein YgdD (TMEM256/DUF423 family)